MTASDSTATEAPKAIWARRSEMAEFSPVPGIHVQPIIGESMMTCWIAMDPGAVVAEHSHVNEQLGVVVEGSVTLTINGETRATEVGDAYVVPSNAVHRAVAGPNGATLVETFVPVREDYRRAWEDAAARR